MIHEAEKQAISLDDLSGDTKKLALKILRYID